ncbi:hypothetical protein PBI_MAHDIA_42 [Gordonia phage Mahdia]|uniref:Uncharacterized protein n=1 Tax=Gordonia phage Mahdia TaxID=2047873 RepID=A0A2H4P9X5_9CAUD|nr:hypothetical protein FDJ14_gp42 [Gordonia phage Mahdia]ATW59041.1 hypothetical protein PBI_MAHDIA_42 [Gordonia phage Mahdia]
MTNSTTLSAAPAQVWSHRGQDIYVYAAETQLGGTAFALVQRISSGLQEGRWSVWSELKLGRINRVQWNSTAVVDSMEEAMAIGQAWVDLQAAR